MQSFLTNKDGALVSTLLDTRKKYQATVDKMRLDMMTLNDKIQTIDSLIGQLGIDFTNNFSGDVNESTADQFDSRV